MSAHLANVALLSSLVACGIKEAPAEPPPSSETSAKSESGSAQETKPMTSPQRTNVPENSRATHTTKASTSVAPGIHPRARHDTLWSLDGTLVQVKSDELVIGTESIAVTRLSGVTTDGTRLVWLQATDSGTQLSLRQGGNTTHKSLLLFGLDEHTRLFLDKQSLWVVQNKASVKQYRLEDEDDLSISDAYFEGQSLVDAAPDGSGGCWVAHWNKLYWVRGETNEKLASDDSLGLIQRLLVARKRLWVLTLTDGLLEVDMSARKVIKRLALPGAGVAIADSGDGFFVATGAHNDHRAVNLHRLADDGTVQWTSGPHPIGDRTLLVMKDTVLYGGSTQTVSLDVGTGQPIP